MDIFVRGDNVLRYLRNKSHILGYQIEYEIRDTFYHGEELKRIDIIYLELLSHSACVGDNDFLFLLSYLKESGFVERIGSNNSLQGCILTVAGYAHLAELEASHTPSSKAFVAMWFDPSMAEVYENGIAPAIRETGFDPVRIDLKEHANKIDDEIIAEIRRSRFVIADFTHGDTGARGGVYYEAGFAHGLGIPVIFSCRTDKLDEVHFDTRQYNHIFWETAEELQGRLANRIAAVIGDGPNKPPS